MFSRIEAIEFAFKNGLRAANFINLREGKIVVFYWEGHSTDLKYGSGPDALGTGGRLVEVLRDREDGWFISAKTDGSWYWYFDDSGYRVPNK